MTDTSTHVSGKAAAVAAAKALLADRIKLVENLGEALDQQQRKAEAATAAAAAEQDATDAVRTAYTAAQTGGWATTELTAAGFPTPTARRRRRPPRGSTDNATDHPRDAPPT